MYIQQEHLLPNTWVYRQGDPPEAVLMIALVCSKEPYLVAKEPYLPQKSPFSLKWALSPSKEPHCVSKEPYFPQKSPIVSQKSLISLKRAP